MEMLRDEYKIFKTATNHNDFCTYFIYPKVFQFPADDEVEVSE